MYSIVSNFNKEIAFASEVKKYLDSLCLIKEGGFSGEYSNAMYYFSFKNDLKNIMVAVSLGDAYNYVLRKSNSSSHTIGTDVDEYLLQLLQNELAENIY